MVDFSHISIFTYHKYMLFVRMYFMHIIYMLGFVSVPCALTQPVSGLSSVPIKICSVLFYKQTALIDKGLIQ